MPAHLSRYPGRKTEYLSSIWWSVKSLRQRFSIKDLLASRVLLIQKVQVSEFFANTWYASLDSFIHKGFRKFRNTYSVFMFSWSKNTRFRIHWWVLILLIQKFGFSQSNTLLRHPTNFKRRPYAYLKARKWFVTDYFCLFFFFLTDSFEDSVEDSVGIQSNEVPFVIKWTRIERIFVRLNFTVKN